jgi:hypothetical protein
VAGYAGCGQEARSLYKRVKGGKYGNRAARTWACMVGLCRVDALTATVGVGSGAGRHKTAPVASCGIKRSDGAAWGGVLSHAVV